MAPPAPVLNSIRMLELHDYDNPLDFMILLNGASNFAKDYSRFAWQVESHMPWIRGSIPTILDLGSFIGLTSFAIQYLYISKEDHSRSDGYINTKKQIVAVDLSSDALSEHFTNSIRWRTTLAVRLNLDFRSDEMLHAVAEIQPRGFNIVTAQKVLDGVHRSNYAALLAHFGRAVADNGILCFDYSPQDQSWEAAGGDENDPLMIGTWWTRALDSNLDSCDTAFERIQRGTIRNNFGFVVFNTMWRHDDLMNARAEVGALLDQVRALSPGRVIDLTSVEDTADHTIGRFIDPATTELRDNQCNLPVPRNFVWATLSEEQRNVLNGLTGEKHRHYRNRCWADNDNSCPHGATKKFKVAYTVNVIFRFRNT